MFFWSTQILLYLLPWGYAGAQQAFMVEPRNQTVRMGSRAVLRCGVLRAEGPVQWVKDGLLLGPRRDLPGFPRYSMVGDAGRGHFHLQVEDAQLDDDGPYECQVGGTESSQPIISNTAWLDVLIPPSRPYFQTDATAAEPWVAGRRYTVVCVAPDAKPEAQVQMFKDGVELMGVERLALSASDERLWDTRATATVFPVSSDDGGLLTCVATNSASPKPVETSLTMRVNYPPRPPVIRGLEGGAVRGGSVLRLVCESQGGSPLAALQWVKDEEVVSSSWQEDLEGGVSSSALQMRVGPELNGARLTCLSRSPATSSPLTASLTLTVLFEPAEVRVLGSYTAVEGGQVELSCVTSSSNPPVSVRWWLGSTELNASSVTLLEGAHGGVATTSNLTQRVGREDHGVPLTCEAFNPATRFSRSATDSLEVFYPPVRVWLEAPPPDPHRAGTRVRLVCFSAGGYPTPTLIWLKNGRPVPGALAARPLDRVVSRELPLVLGPSDNMAAYRCDAHNEAGVVLSADTRIHVLYPAVSVKIVAREEGVRAGQTLHLHCQSGSSHPKANVSWTLGALRLSGEEQAPRAAAFGGVSVGSTLSLLLLPRYHGQRLVCQAYSAPLGEGTSTFYPLTVLYPPEFSPNQPSLVRVVEDETAVLPLLVSANPEEMTCTWTHNQQVLTRERDLRWAGAEGYSLEIRNASRRHAGRYVAQCENQEGRRHSSLTLDVLYGPGVRPRSALVEAARGDTADLMCVSDANPAALITWSWMGEGEMDLGEGVTEEEVGVLTIPEVSRGHAGRYQCTADNGIAPPAGAEVQLVVSFAPELQRGGQWSRVGSRGDGSTEAELRCRAEGIPPVSFTWEKNSMPLDLENPRYVERTVRDGSFSSSSLVVLNVSAVTDFAVFTCLAANALGEDRLHVTLLSTSPPDPPSDLGLVGVTQDSVTLDWVPNFNGGLSQRYRIRYRGPLSNSFTYVDVSPPAAVVYTVSGLAPLTAYTFWVGALNAAGESGYEGAAPPLSVTTGDRSEQDQGSGGEDEDPQGLPVSLASTLAALGGLLLVFNSLGCFLGWRRRSRRRRQGLQTGHSRTSEQSSVSDEKKSYDTESRGSTGGGSARRYESRERINAGAQCTLIADSGSETQSNVYESYATESRCYYPARAYLPPGHAHPEERRRPTETAHRRPGLSQPPGHEYEAVRESGWYQDLHAPPPSFPPPAPPAYPQGVRGLRGAAEDSLTPGAYELPFDLRGELV